MWELARRHCCCLPLRREQRKDQLPLARGSVRQSLKMNLSRMRLMLTCCAWLCGGRVMEVTREDAQEAARQNFSSKRGAPPLIQSPILPAFSHFSFTLTSSTSMTYTLPGDRAVIPSASSDAPVRLGPGLLQSADTDALHVTRAGVLAQVGSGSGPGTKAGGWWIDTNSKRVSASQDVCNRQSVI